MIYHMFASRSACEDAVIVVSVVALGGETLNIRRIHLRAGTSIIYHETSESPTQVAITIPILAQAISTACQVTIVAVSYLKALMTTMCKRYNE